MTIWKYTITVDDEFRLRMPTGAQILAVQMQQGAPRLWALMDPTQPLQEWIFRVVGTGHPFEDAQDYCHRGTFQLEGGLLVFHLFQRTRGG